ncbi:MAG: ATP-binding protein [Candidatus Paceibacterota bacterium]
MSTNAKAHIPLKKSEYQEHRERVNPKLKIVEWTPKKDAANKMVSTAAQPGTWLPASSIDFGGGKDSVKIRDSVAKIFGDESLLDVDAVYVLDSIRTGFMIGMRVFELYCQASGLDQLILRNTSSRLLESEMKIFNSQKQTGTFASVFATASYIRWKLSSYKADKTSVIDLPFGGIPEINLTDNFVSTNCILYYYGLYLERGNIVRDSTSFIKFSLMYFENVLDELSKRLGAMEYMDFFTNNSYKLEDEEFIIDGFEMQSVVVVVSREFNRVDFGDIVGNVAAKHAARRKAMRLACYDVKLKKNPWHVMKGLTPICLGHGNPGTGKSLIIAATATYAQDLCDKRGIPFLFHPMPDNIVSGLQGESATNMLKWMQRFHDSDKVIYGPIDDGENYFKNRSGDDVSEGERILMGVFLRYTEGAYAINNGNWAIDLMTNLPETIDPAIMSRVQSKFPIDGAMSVEDFVDQDYLWWSKFAESNPDFVDIKPISRYEFMSGQRKLASLDEIETGEVQIADPRILEIFEEIRKDHEICEAEFFGKLYMQVRKVIPMFSSRDLRNIQSAVNIRAMDFDMPEEFFDDHSLFFEKPFEDRLKVLRGLMSDNVKGMKLSDVIYREAITYLVNAARIGSVEDEREISAMLKRGSNRLAAQKRAADLGISPNVIY